MKHLLSCFFFFCFLLNSVFTFSQIDTTKDEYVNTYQLRYEDWVYVPNIKSVLLYESSFLLSSPIIDFDGGQQLTLTFDDLDGETKPYYYTLIHCDAAWKPSDLMQQEYLTNYFEEQINTYNFLAVPRKNTPIIPGTSLITICALVKPETIF